MNPNEPNDTTRNIEHLRRSLSAIDLVAELLSEVAMIHSEGGEASPYQIGRLADTLKSANDSAQRATERLEKQYDQT